MAFYDKFVIKPGTKVDISKFDPDDTCGWTKEDARERIAKNHTRMKDLQALMYAEHKHSLLAVFQAMDAGGKDGAVNNNGSVMNIEGVRATSYKAPSKRELDQDFLWRIEAEMPGKGMVGLFNRSHYEDVLVARVKNFAPKKTIEARYKLINEFEKRHVLNGTDIVKFYLLISQEEQWKRFGERAGNPDKKWKLADGVLKNDGSGEYTGGDLLESQLWPEHQKAASIALSRTSKEDRPWIIVPSNHKWFRDLIVSQVMVDRLEAMHMEFPKPAVNTDKILEKHFAGNEWKKLRDIFNEARDKAANDSVAERKLDKPEHKRAQKQAKQKHG
jgi:PPK2 family polyphosphate:nucleotide phosphotransferase